MTTELIELSKKAAEVLGVPANAFLTRFDESTYSYHEQEFWLAEDSGRCAEIAADKQISTNLSSDIVVSASHIRDGKFIVRVIEYLADHNNERIKAYCVAVCKAVLEQARE